MNNQDIQDLVSNVVEDVKTFYNVAGFIPKPELAVALVVEESKELTETGWMTMEDLEHRLKELGDYIYTSAGIVATVNEYGIDAVEETLGALPESDKEAMKSAKFIFDTGLDVELGIFTIDILEDLMFIIHGSNMSKFPEDDEGRLYNPNKGQGKVPKGPDYVTPDLSHLAEDLAQYWYDTGLPTPLDFIPTQKEAA